MNQNKIIFITIETGFQARDVLRSDFFKLLQANEAIRVVLLVPAAKLDFYQKLYGGDRVAVEAVPEKKDKNFLETLAYFFGKSSIHSHTITIHHRRFWAAQKNINLIKKTVYFLAKRILWHLGGLRLWRELVRKLFWLGADGSHYDALFAKYKPALIYAVNLLRFDEFRMLKRAREKGIKTISYILSWDNLNSKLFVFVKSDKYIVTTDFVKQEAINLADVKPEQVEAIGVIKYDRYFKREGMIGKGEFFRQNNFSLDKKLIVYGLSSTNTSPRYGDIIDDLRALELAGHILEPHQFVIRTYPKYALAPELIQKIKDYGFIYNQPGDFVGEGEGGFEIKTEDDDFFTNLFGHADLIITNYCTIVIESAILGKPVININYDGHTKKDYLFSINRIRDYTHYQQIVRAGGERPANSKEELGELINMFLKSPQTDFEGRQRVVYEQCLFTDGKTGQRMYNCITGSF